MKKVQMPKQEPAELEANIEFEAQNVIPENLENVNLDHQVLQEIDGGNKMDVLLVAVKKEIVNSYADAIEEAGLTPTSWMSTISPWKICMKRITRMKPNTVSPESSISARSTRASHFLQNGISIFTGDLSVGGAYFTDIWRGSSAYRLRQLKHSKQRLFWMATRDLDLESTLKTDLRRARRGNSSNRKPLWRVSCR
jgi:type IV pilus assembly protein PilM